MKRAALWTLSVAALATVLAVQFGGTAMAGGMATGGLQSTLDPRVAGTSAGANTGDVTVGAFGSTPAAAGASLSGQVLTLQPASATLPGGIAVGTQSFPPGDRSANGNVSVTGNLVVAALSTPTNDTYTTAATGGTLTGATTYYYRVAATTATGTTLASTEVAKATAAGTNTNTITAVWLQVTGATGYKVYCRSTGAELLCATITSATTLSWTDTGSVSPSGALPAANTTGAVTAVTLTLSGLLTVNNSAVITSNLSAVNFQSGGTDSAQIRGIQADGSGAIGVKITNATTLTTAGSTIAEFSPNNYVTRKARVDLNGFFLQPAQTVTVANDGAGSAPASTITPSSSLVLLAYNDVTNASVGTLVETGAQEGSVVQVVHTGSGGTVVFTEVAGQQEIGATPCTMGLSDTLTAIYANSSWHFLSCRDN